MTRPGYVREWVEFKARTWHNIGHFGGRSCIVEDTRGQKNCADFRSKIGTNFGNVCYAKKIPISDSDENVFYSEVDFRKHVIDSNSCDWLKFIENLYFTIHW